MRKKFLSVALVAIFVISTFAGLCLATNAAELPNLFELYGYEPGFENHVGPFNVNSGVSNTMQSNDISYDGDNKLITVANRTSATDGPRITVNVSEAGTYYFSYYVKTFDKTKEFEMYAIFNDDTGFFSLLLSKTTVYPWNDWVKVENTANLSKGENTLSIYQGDFAEDNAPNLLIDGIVFAKNDNKNNNLLPNIELGNVGTNAYLVDVSPKTGNGYAITVSRTQGYGLPGVGGVYAKTLFDEQGTGNYTLSFDVKTLNPNQSAQVKAIIELKGKDESGKTVTQTLALGDAKTVDGNWQNIETTINVPSKLTSGENQYDITEITFRPAQLDFDSSNPTEFVFDNFCLTKSDYNADTNTVTTKPVERTPYQSVSRNTRTGIGAIYYQMWFETLDSWWEKTSEEDFWNYSTDSDYNSTQEARSLSVAKYQFHLPFFATINTEITSSTCTRGDLSKGVAEFPAFTQEIWTQEMEYAIDAGIDFMAYLWARNDRPKDAYETAYQYHIKTGGLNNRIKMCAILQDESQDLDTMAKAMTEKYWYTIDGMPVVYIYGGNKAATEMFVSLIRRKLAIAQKVKYGAVGVPAYIIVMDNNTYENAQKAENLGVDATGWYGTGSGIDVATSQEKTSKTISELNSLTGDNKSTSINVIKFSATARNNLQTMQTVAPIAQDGNISVSPVIVLGHNTEPRILNPVSWNFAPTKNADKAALSKTTLSNNASSDELPTPDEMAEHVLNILNFNKENASTFNTNTVLIYAWNEFNEGGWFCPNLKFDENGNVVPGEVNREYLDAVKLGIARYREHEAENRTYNMDGSVKVDNIQIPAYTENTVKINIKGSIDAIDLGSVNIIANEKKVTPVVDTQEGTLTCEVEKNAQITVTFDEMGLYTPVSIQYAGVKGNILGINEYSFTAYGNLTELDVVYQEVEGELKTVTMFYVNAAGARVVFDNFAVSGDLVEKINNYPTLYNKKFKCFTIGETNYATAEAVAAQVVGAQTEIEVAYIDTVTAIIEGYTIAKHENMTVKVNGVEAQAKVEPYALATFTADAQKDGQTFSYWADASGQPISYNSVYTRYVTGNIDIYPVYGASVEKVAVTIKVADNEDKLVLIAERSLSKDCQILEHGIILAEYVNNYLELEHVGESEQGKVYLGHRINTNNNVLNNGTYILTKTDKHSLGGKYSEKDTTLSFVAFVRYEDAEGNEYIKYSPVDTTKVIKAEIGPSIDFDEFD